MTEPIDGFIRTSAPSKFILSGEYAVCYEKAAVAFAIDLRTTVTVTKNKEQKLRLNFNSFKQTREWPLIELRNTYKLVTKLNNIWTYDGWPSSLNYLLNEKYIHRHSDSSDIDRDTMATNSTKVFLLLFLAIGDSYRKSARLAIDVDVTSDVPPGSGLGSSSSYSVALSDALLRAYRVIAEHHIVERWAFNAEKFFHGRPSGIDTNVVTNGGCILFFTNSKTKHKDKSNLFKVLLIDSGVSRSTKEMLVKVSTRRVTDADFINEIFTQIDQISQNIWRALNGNSANDSIYDELKGLIEQNQELLEQLQVGHPKLTQIINLCTEAGLASKMTGAGGGGFAFALYQDEHLDSVVRLKRQLENLGFKYYDVEAGVVGLTHEEKNFYEQN